MIVQSHEDNTDIKVRILNTYLKLSPLRFGLCLVPDLLLDSAYTILSSFEPGSLSGPSSCDFLDDLGVEPWSVFPLQ